MAIAVVWAIFLFLSMSLPMGFPAATRKLDMRNTDCTSVIDTLENLRACLDAHYDGDPKSPDYACRYVLGTWSIAETVRTRLDEAHHLLTIPYLQGSDCSTLYPDGYYISTLDEATLLAVSLYGEIPSLPLNPYRIDSYASTISYFLGETPYLEPARVEARVISEEVLGDYIRRKIEYRSATNDWVPAYLLLPLGFGYPRPAVLALHQTVEQGKDEPVGIKGNINMAYGLELVRRGYVVLAPDTITAGERVKPGEYPYDTTSFDNIYPNWSAMGKMLWDHQRGIDYLQSLPEVDPDAIGVIGHSLGGYNALFLAALDQRIRVVIASSAYTRMETDPNREGWARASGFVHFPRLRSYLLDFTNTLPWDFQHLIALIAPRPVWQSFGLSDTIFVNGLSTVQVQDVVAPFYERFGMGDKLQTKITNGSHGFPYFLRQNAYEFLDSQLTSAPTNESESGYWYGEFTRLESRYRQTWNKNLVRFEEAALPQGDGALVGWVDGSYALPAYLDMYDWSKDRLYLDRFGTRAKQLISYMWDANDDGVPGWPASRYSTNYIKNGGFEAGTSDWNGISIGENLVKNEDGGPGFLFDVSGIGCDKVLSGAYHGDWHLTLDSSSVVTQAITQLPQRSVYGLRMDVKTPVGVRLIVKMYTSENPTKAVALDRQVFASPLQGPQGWQQFSTVVDTKASSSITLTLSIAGELFGSSKVIVDNVIFSPYEEYLAEEFAMAGVLARFAVLVGTHPELAEYRAVGETFSGVAAQIVEKWQPYWRQVDEERGVYIAPSDDSLPGFQGRSLPYNMMSLAGSAQLWLSQSPYAKQTDLYRKQSLALARTLHHAIRIHPETIDSLIWNYGDPILPTDPQSPGGIEDISHAGPSVAFIGQLARAHEVFTKTEVVNIVHTLTKVVWNQSETQPIFSRFLDGGGGPIPPTLGMPYFRHLELDRSPALRSAVSAAWDNAQTYLGCHVRHRTSLTGRNLSVPALMLLTEPIDTYLSYLSLITQ